MHHLEIEENEVRLRYNYHFLRASVDSPGSPLKLVLLLEAVTQTRSQQSKTMTYLLASQLSLILIH